MDWAKQVANIKEATAQAPNNEEDDNKGSKPSKLKPKSTSHKGKAKQKSSSLQKINLADHDLDKLFALGEEKNNQDHVKTSSNEPKKEPKEAGSKNKDSWPSCKDGKKSPKGSGGSDCEGSPALSGRP